MPAREITTQRKDRNVKRSSHGKFADVADLVAHQKQVSKPGKVRVPDRFEVRGNWLSRDPQGSRALADYTRAR